MPKPLAADPTKRRVRTGCLTCRRRRRKCDEGKPNCDNCKLKGLACRYGVNITFVDSLIGSQQPSIQSPAEESSHSYSKIVFVDDAAGDNRTSTNERSEDNVGIKHHSPESIHPPPTVRSYSNQTIGSQTIENNFRSSNTPNETFIGSSGGPPTGTSHSSSIPSIRSLLNQDFNQGHGLRRSQPPSSEPSIPYTLSIEYSGSPDQYELDLLCHYRYCIAPWIDIGDYALPFSIDALSRSVDSLILRFAILALAATHRHRSQRNDDLDHEKGLEYANRAIQLMENDRSVHIATASIILCLRDIILSSPARWYDIVSTCATSLNFYNDSFVKSLNPAECWTLLKIDIAAAIARSKPLILAKSDPIASTLQSSMSFISAVGHRLPQDPFKHALRLLINAITIAYPHREVRSQFSNLPMASHWSSTWSESQIWYTSRSPELQQVFELDGHEIDDMISVQSSALPTIIFSSAMALVANAAHHITSLLLLLHKPRLVKPIAEAESSVSPIWHAQCIAGIAASNDIPECWDPIVVSGLLMAAKRLTHNGQQDEILLTLQKISETMGFDLDSEIKSLQGTWNLAADGESW